MYEELIKALQLHCEAGKKIGLNGAIWTLLDDATTALKSLTAQLATLQSENAELKQWLDKVNDFEKSQCTRLLERLSRMKAERDAAIADISHVCPTCGQFQGGDCPVLFYKDYPKDCEHWRWRGVQGEG